MSRNKSNLKDSSSKELSILKRLKVLKKDRYEVLQASLRDKKVWTFTFRGKMSGLAFSTQLQAINHIEDNL
jgi:hypothetical protein